MHGVPHDHFPETKAYWPNVYQISAIKRSLATLVSAVTGD